MNTFSISLPVNPSVALLNCTRSKSLGLRPYLPIWISQIASRSAWLGKSTNISSLNLPFLSISGGNWETSLAVATTNTGFFFSCIHAMQEPKTQELVPPSVAFELLVPLIQLRLLEEWEDTAARLGK